MKVAVIYARYSSDNQTEQSIDGQLHVCQDYAKRNDILILAEIAFQKRRAHIVEINQILDIPHQKQLRLSVVEADAEAV